MPGKELIPAILYYNHHHNYDVNMSDYLAGRGYKYRRSVDSEGVFSSDVLYFDLVPCLDLYSQDEELAGYFTDSFTDDDSYATSGWLCFPSDTTIEVQNDAWVSVYGVDTGFIIENCNVAYPDSTDCVTDSTELTSFEREVRV